MRVKTILVSFLLLCVGFTCVGEAHAQDTDFAFSTGNLTQTILLLGALAIIPAIFVSMTAFVRIAIVLSMLRHALAMPETPPNPILIALSAFLTIFVMSPTMEAVNREALQPLVSESISLETAFQNAQAPIRNFMLSQIQDDELLLMYNLSERPIPQQREEVDVFLLVPAFILHELKVAFTIGFIIMLPFLLIDLIVASILLSLGMMMVPPATISLPIKLLLFVTIDGWTLILRGLLGGFA